MGRVHHRRTFLARAARLSGAAVATSTIGSGFLGSFAEITPDLGFDLGVGASPRGRRRPGTMDPPPILSRSDWRADESRRRGGRSFRAPRKFVVHHTVTPNRDDHPARTMRDIYDMHLNRFEAGRYWSDIGYHFVIAPDGRIYEGRYAREYGRGTHDGEDRYGRAVVGSHAGEVNGGSMGIALMGNFSRRLPTPEAVESLVQLLTWKCLEHDLNPQGREPFLDSSGNIRDFPTIVGHRQVRTTACPGGVMQELIPRVRRAVALRMRKYENEREDRPGGYHVLTASGLVVPRGSARFEGDPWHEGRRPHTAAMATTPDGKGYWLLKQSGEVAAFGQARSHGDLDSQDTPVDMAATPSGRGYWVLTAGGAVARFGDAAFHGSVRGRRQAGKAPAAAADPAVGIAPTPSGNGYWVVSAKGRVYAFGDADSHGSLRQLRQRRRTRSRERVADIAAAPDGRGYWMLGRDGDVFGFGSAEFHGSVPGTSDGAAIAASRSGRGYHVLTRDGAVLAFGDARARGHGPALPAVDIAGERPTRRVRMAAAKTKPKAKSRPQPERKRKRRLSRAERRRRERRRERKQQERRQQERRRRRRRRARRR